MTSNISPAYLKQFNDTASDAASEVLSKSKFLMAWQERLAKLPERKRAYFANKIAEQMADFTAHAMLGISLARAGVDPTKYLQTNLTRSKDHEKSIKVSKKRKESI